MATCQANQTQPDTPTRECELVDVFRAANGGGRLENSEKFEEASRSSSRTGAHGSRRAPGPPRRSGRGCSTTREGQRHRAQRHPRQAARPTRSRRPRGTPSRSRPQSPAPPRTALTLPSPWCRARSPPRSRAAGMTPWARSCCGRTRPNRVAKREPSAGDGAGGHPFAQRYQRPDIAERPPGPAARQVHGRHVPQGAPVEEGVGLEGMRPELGRIHTQGHDLAHDVARIDLPWRQRRQETGSNSQNPEAGINRPPARASAPICQATVRGIA